MHLSFHKRRCLAVGFTLLMLKCGHLYFNYHLIWRYFNEILWAALISTSALQWLWFLADQPWDHSGWASELAAWVNWTFAGSLTGLVTQTSDYAIMPTVDQWEILLVADSGWKLLKEKKGDSGLKMGKGWYWLCPVRTCVRVVGAARLTKKCYELICWIQYGWAYFKMKVVECQVWHEIDLFAPKAEKIITTWWILF